MNIGKLTDNNPVLHRHYEATLPPQCDSLSDLIPCSQVQINQDVVDTEIRKISGVKDVALQQQSDETVDVYVSVALGSALSSNDILSHLSSVLPGYAIPDHIFTLPALLRDASGDFQFETMQKESLRTMFHKLNKHQLLVCDIFSSLLNVDAAHVRPDSDFFLLGGNSMLLGQLTHHIRKRSSVTIGITELFAESTVNSIASIIEKRAPQEAPDDEDDEDPHNKGTRNSSRTFLSAEYDYEHDAEFTQGKGLRGQKHPLCLIVQIIPYLFFYPLKAALTCKYKPFI